MTKIKVSQSWEEQDIKDFFFDFINIDLNNVTDSISKTIADFEEDMIEKGYTREQAQTMGEGVDRFLEKIIEGVNWVK
jgi:predicted Ser/Thr protein kinase